MSQHRRTVQQRRSLQAKVRRRRRVIGWGSSAGAVVAFGMGPLAAAPAGAGR